MVSEHMSMGSFQGITMHNHHHPAAWASRDRLWSVTHLQRVSPVYLVPEVCIAATCSYKPNRGLSLITGAPVFVQSTTRQGYASAGRQPEWKVAIRQ
jgi:hypothetical protein